MGYIRYRDVPISGSDVRTLRIEFDHINNSLGKTTVLPQFFATSSILECSIPEVSVLGRNSLTQIGSTTPQLNNPNPTYIFENVSMMETEVFGNGVGSTTPTGASSLRLPQYTNLIPNNFQHAMFQYIFIGSNIPIVPNDCFNGLVQLRGIGTLVGTHTIGERAFNRCMNLQFNIPSTVRYVNSDAFNGCSSLKGNLPSSLERVESGGFAACTTFTPTSLPNSCNFLGTYAFGNCFQLNWSSLPSGITVLRRGVFHRTSVSFTNLPYVTQVYGDALSRCENLTSITLGSVGRPVTFIQGASPTLGHGASFVDCPNLHTIRVYRPGGAALAGAPWGAPRPGVSVQYLNA